MEKKINIAIDGNSSCGKSTLAKDLAQKLGYVYVDTGAMYRAVTLFALEQTCFKNEDPDRDKLLRVLDGVQIRFNRDDEGKLQTLLNGKNVEEEIRTMRVSERVSKIAEIKEVRKKLVTEQQKMGKDKGVVMDGRDIGTVVFPDAELKLFMTADHEVRTERRFNELKNKGYDITREKVSENLKQRDEIDSNRVEDPLRKADDAIVLDTSDKSPEEQLEFAVKKVREL